MLADLFIIDGDPAAPYDALLKATPAQVQLVMVGGQPLFGDAGRLPPGFGADRCEMMPVCGHTKFFCIAIGGAGDKLGQKVSEIKAVLEQAMLDVDAATASDGWDFAPLTPMVKCAAP
ncbi:MAG: hypothetical protein HY902_14985 [Deltaproteobacteria bacterium]|nr:hypothetical protein [Deltaproteobacteria bacterium]